MKFTDKYPDADYLSVSPDGMLRGKELLPCWHCGEPTPFVEINYEARICSEECLAAIDVEVSERCCETGLEDYEDEFEPGRVNVNMLGLNP